MERNSKLLSKTYKYNSKLVQTIKCSYVPWPEVIDYEALKEVMQLAEGEKDADVLPPSSAQSNIEARKLSYQHKFIDYCKANNIELVMYYSPYFGQTIHESIRMLAVKNGVQFLNYGDDVHFQKTE